MKYSKEFKRLREHASSQCAVYEDDNTIEFYSYRTKVIEIIYKAGKRLVKCTGLYSATTRRQIGWFLREYAPDLNYYDIKAIAGEGFVTL